jgi:DNA-binding GntR family transcriptional regulator
LPRTRGESESIVAAGEEADGSAPERLPVLELIRDAILNAEFVPGQRLVEADLSERFQASRGAVRFALVQLTAEGLVERIPNRGARVRAVTLEEAIEIFEIRMVVEGLCAAKAAERVTEAEAAELRTVGARMADAVAAGDVLGYSRANSLLHRRVCEISGQSTAVRVLEWLRSPSVRHHFGQTTRPERLTDSLHEHQAMIDAICAHDPEAAERVTQLHLSGVVDGLEAILAARSGGTAAGRPTPSERARELVRDAYDVHIHIAADATRRRTDDLTLASRFAEVGLAGFVLTSDHFPTAERAAVVRGAVPGFGAVGAVTLNASVGGMNPVAVEFAGRSGAQVVWMPTGGMPAGPVEVVGPDGQVLEATRQVLRVVAKHDMTLATGHLGAAETEAVVDAAVAAGVRRVLVAYPEPASQRVGAERVGVDWQRRLAAKGALLERCFAAPYTGKISWAVWLENIRAVGVEHSVLSSGLGQPEDPPVGDGLALLADRLLAGGFTEDEVRIMAVHNSRWLAGADERRAIADRTAP